jgi:hypothetical protein
MSHRCLHSLYSCRLTGFTDGADRGVRTPARIPTRSPSPQELRSSAAGVGCWRGVILLRTKSSLQIAPSESGFQHFLSQPSLCLRRIHLGLWQEGVRVHSGTDPPGETTLNRLDDPFPDYDTNRSWRSPPPETSGSAQGRLSPPLFSGSQPSGGSCV